MGDEFKPAEPAAEPLADGRLRLPGGMAVDEAATLLKTMWETDSATVGGLVTAALGHLPASGEVVTIGDYEFEVERVTDRAIGSVLARRVTPEPVEVPD
jgi:CBS domain containing-hemolysin-like protein